MEDVVLYTRETCSECVKAKRLLNEKNIPYKEMVIDKDITRDQVLEDFPNARALPLIVTKHKAIFTGYNGLLQELENDRHGKENLS